MKNSLQKSVQQLRVPLNDKKQLLFLNLNVSYLNIYLWIPKFWVGYFDSPIIVAGLIKS